MEPGSLHLPTQARAVAESVAWADVPAHQWLLLGCALLILLLIPEIRNLLPALGGCLTRSRGNLEVEHSLSVARSRDQCARLLAIPLLLMVDRYGLYSPSFVPGIGEPWLRLAVLFAALIAYFALRRILHTVLLSIRGLRLNSESRSAITRGIYNYYICNVLVMLMSISILYVFNAGDGTVRWVLWSEMAAFWLLAIVRESQILHGFCSTLVTFLYLCGLELLPAGALIVSGFLL